MMFSVLRRSTLGLALLGTSLAAQADWTLDPERSSFYYLTSKASQVTELNTFDELDGSISDSGMATLEISLASVDTTIPIRNERMQKILFETEEFPLGKVEVDVSQLDLSGLQAGEMVQEHFSAALSLHGVTNSVETDLDITVLENNDLHVSSHEPLIVNAGQFGLSDAVGELREIAGLPSINPNVVVSFSLVYENTD